MRRKTQKSKIPEKPMQGPWTNNKEYNHGTISEKITEELRDLSEWLSPTHAEKQIRLLVIHKIKTFVEESFNGITLCVQGSSANGSYIPTSDIDFLAFGLKEGSDPVIWLRQVVRMLRVNKMVQYGFVIANAKVPIAKLVESPFGFSIDIGVSAVNGVLNIPRMKKLFHDEPNVFILLRFLKAFCHQYNLDEPAKGGFGSTHLACIAQFAVKYNQGMSLGDQLLWLLNLIGQKLNYFFVGISTVGDGLLFSKLDTNLIDNKLPQALLCEDPQCHGRFIGYSGREIFKLSDICARVYKKLVFNWYDTTPLTSVLGTLGTIVNRRNELKSLVKHINDPPHIYMQFCHDQRELKMAQNRQY